MLLIAKATNLSTYPTFSVSSSFPPQVSTRLCRAKVQFLPPPCFTYGRGGRGRACQAACRDHESVSYSYKMIRSPLPAMLEISFLGNQERDPVVGSACSSLISCACLLNLSNCPPLHGDRLIRRTHWLMISGSMALVSSVDPKVIPILAGTGKCKCHSQQREEGQTHRLTDWWAETKRGT